jgi:hypothetical protein
MPSSIRRWWPFVSSASSSKERLGNTTTGCGLVYSFALSFEIVQNILALNEERRPIVATLLWYWWTNSNKANNCEKHLGTEEVQFEINMHVGEWKDFLKKNQNYFH